MALIARLYSDRQTAEAASADLKAKGEDFGTEIITAPQSAATPADMAEATPAPAPAHDTAADEALLARIKQAGLAPGHAEIYAWHLRGGEALLVTRPLFMHGVEVSEILDGFHPVKVDLPLLEVPPSPAQSRSAPLSTYMKWPVLLSDPEPLSRRLGWRTITSRQATMTSRESISAQSRDPAPLSRAVKMPTLSPNPAPLSSLVKWRTLWDNPAPLSARIKWRTLLDDPAPLSRRLGWRTIAKSPAPLSRSTATAPAEAPTTACFL